MALLEYAARTIPMGTAYAVWGGIGAIGTVLVGMAWFGEPATTIRMLLILGIVACIAGLKLTRHEHRRGPAAPGSRRRSSRWARCRCAR